MPLNAILLCCQVVIHTIRLPKQSTVGDVINDLKMKVILQFFAFQHWTCDSNFNQSYFLIPIVAIYQIHMHQKKEFKKKKLLRLYLEQVELSHPNAELRLLEVFYHKIYKVKDIVRIYILSEWKCLIVKMNCFSIISRST